MNRLDSYDFVPNRPSKLSVYTKILRLILPIVLHYYNLHLLEIFEKPVIPLESDFQTIASAISTSFFLLRYDTLLLYEYTPNSIIAKILFEIISQIMLVELEIRLIEIPFNFILYYLCVNGYIANVLNTFHFVLFIMDYFIPYSKFVRLSRTKEGFEMLRIFYGILRIIHTVYIIELHLPMMCFFSQIFRAIEFTVTCVSGSISKPVKGRKY